MSDKYKGYAATTEAGVKQNVTAVVNELKK
jgi:hypothetical protein